MPFLYGGSNAGATGQSGVPVLDFSLQNSFSSDVALGDIPGVRPFFKQVRDTLTTQTNPPRFVIDINMVQRKDLTANTTLYISSSSASDVGQLVIVDGISIVDIGGFNKLKEVFGFALTNGLSQVEVTELGTGSPLPFFRINTLVNQSSPFSGFQGAIYLAEFDNGGSPPLGIPSLTNTQDVITLVADFSASIVSYEFSQGGSYTIPQVLFTGETVRGVTLATAFVLPDSTAQVYSQIITYNGDGAVIGSVMTSSFQTGSPAGLVFGFGDLFLVQPGSENKFYARLGSNNQAITLIVAGKLYYTP